MPRLAPAPPRRHTEPRLADMPGNLWKSAAAGLLLCRIVAASCADSTPGFHVRVWGVEDGLPQSAVLTLIQSREGYLWAGTLDGLARFDGLHFTTFRPANTPGLSSSRILKLFEDSQTNLWIGTESAGVFLVRQGRVISLDIGRGTRQGRLMSACEDRRGAVWLYTADGQLCRYQDKQVNVWNAGAGLASNCRAVITDDDGLTWVGSDWQLTAIGEVPAGPATGLPVVYEFHFPVTARPDGRPGLARRLDALLASRQGGYWRLADNRIQKWKRDQMQRDLGPYPWTEGVPITAVCEDAEGNLVVGTHGDGVFWFQADGRYARLSTAELSQSAVLSLAMDREGCLWVGLNGGGLARVKRHLFEVLEATRGTTVQSVAEDVLGGLWVGYNDQRIERFASGSAVVFTDFEAKLDLHTLGPMKCFVRSVFVDRQQQVWAGTVNGGLLRLSENKFRQAPGPDLLRRDVSAVYQDSEGRLWAGTEAGLAWWDGSQWQRLTAQEGLPAFPVRALAEDGGTGLWVGTDGGGLAHWQEGRFEVFTRTNGLPSDNVTALLRDRDDALWVGTSSGLCRFATGRWTSYAERLGPAGDSIAFLLEDNLDHLWLGTTAGLLRVARKELADLAAGLIPAVAPRLYGRAEGLPSPECTQGSQPAACRTRDGRVWFPTIKGLVTVDPAQLKRNTNPPPVMIEAVYLDGRRLDAGTLGAAPLSEVTVPPGSQALEIRYTSLNLAAPEKARFRYRLNPHETQWTEVEADRRVVRYPRLPPGRYRFEVTASNEDGVWNLAGTSLGVVVQPPFWRTWWFLTLVTLALLGAIVGSVHYVSTQKLQRQLAALRQQEALEKERARIARDLHDQLGANLTQVALLGEMAEADKHLPEEIENHARQISQTARETTRALDEIVWTVNPANDTLDGLVTYLCKYAQEYLALAGLQYRLEVPPQLPATPISPELRHNVFLVAKEAINNIVKHSRASAARLRLRLDSAQFILEIEDNGQGLPPNVESKGRNGLRNMRRRMEDLGGQFQAGPGPEGGTCIRLTVPLRALARGGEGG